jgi:SAM-dependent methyltransferase
LSARRGYGSLDGVTNDRSVQATSFGSVAAVYERGRPPYPPAALDWLLPPGARRVLDLGAGTGKLTRLLTERGLDVVAVEPSEGMRAELARVLPEVRALEGTAERIPLADGAVDAVLAAQAWHWVDPARAVPEVARVLAPGGTLGLVWNIRDERVDWVGRLGRLLHQSGDQYDESVRPTVGPPFAPVERLDVEWTYHLRPPVLLDMVASRSYIITLPPAGQAAVLDQVQQLLDAHPDLANRDDIAMPYVTRCSRARLSG